MRAPATAYKYLAVPYTALLFEQGGRNAGIATCWYNPRRRDASALVDHDIAGHDASLALVQRVAP